MVPQVTGEVFGNIRFEVVKGVPRASAIGSLGAQDLALIRAHPERELKLSYVSGWIGEPLDFLKELPNLRRLFLMVNRKLDVSPISSLIHLECLAVHCTTSGKIEFGDMSRLKACHLRWQPGLKQVFEATALETLELVAYPGHDLIPLQQLARLRALQVMASRLWTTVGLARLTRLQVLDVRGCRRLERLEEVDTLTQLEELNVEGCSKLTSLTSAFQLPRLRRLLAGDCPRLATLVGIEHLAALEELYLDGSARVEDGNLAPLLDLPSLRKLCIHWRKTYAPPEVEFARLVPR